MASIELVLAMLLAVIVSAYLVRALPIALPLPIVQILLGSLIAASLDHPARLDPSVFFLLFLPPLLFLDGWRIPKDGLRRDKTTILRLALGLVVVTVFGVGHLIHWLIPAMPLAVAFALAAVLSPTDPVAVSSITARIAMPPRLMHILEGESLLNDASGLVCFQFAVAAALTGTFSAGWAALTFLWVALGGLLCGLVFTLAIAFVQQWLARQFGEDSGTPILVSLLIPFGAYQLAEAMQASGILAAVAAGITMSYVELTGHAMARTRLERGAVWDTIAFTLNGIMFVLLGEQLPGILKGAVTAVQESGHVHAWWLAVYALAITVGLAGLRCLWVWLSLHLYLLLKRRHGRMMQAGPRWRLIFATSLAGVRGAITLAGILTLPLLMPDGSPFPARNLAIFLAAAVIVLSLVGATFGLPLLLKELRLPEESTAQQREDHARAVVAKAAIEAVNRGMQHIQASAEGADVDMVTHAASRVLAVYQQRLTGTENTDVDAERVRRAEDVERRLRLAALQGERAKVLELTRKHRISDDISRRLVHEIDLIEATYR